MERIEVKNIRASDDAGDTRWFHGDCYQQSDEWPKRYPHIVDFPKKAKSPYTRCLSCMEAINRPEPTGVEAAE